MLNMDNLAKTLLFTKTILSDDSVQMSQISQLGPLDSDIHIYTYVI